MPALVAVQGSLSTEKKGQGDGGRVRTAAMLVYSSTSTLLPSFTSSSLTPKPTSAQLAAISQISSN